MRPTFLPFTVEFLPLQPVEQRQNLEQIVVYAYVVGCFALLRQSLENHLQFDLKIEACDYA